jgi:hypothetical protein
MSQHIAQQIAESAVKIKQVWRFPNRTDCRLTINAALNGNEPLCTDNLDGMAVELKGFGIDFEDIICSLSFQNPLYDPKTESMRSVVIEDGTEPPADYAERQQTLVDATVAALLKHDELMLRCAIWMRETKRFSAAGWATSQDGHRVTNFIREKIALMGFELCMATMAKFGSQMYYRALRETASKEAHERAAIDWLQVSGS